MSVFEAGKRNRIGCQALQSLAAPAERRKAQPTVNQYRTLAAGTRSVTRAMVDRRTAPGTPLAQDGRPVVPGAAAPVPRTPPTAPSTTGSVARPSPDASTPRRPLSALDPGPRRPAAKFGAAADGWDAYNSWLDRVRQSPPPSRQAVIAKSLYSVSSYKSWADKARGAFDPASVPGGVTPAAATGGKVVK